MNEKFEKLQNVLNEQSKLGKQKEKLLAKIAELDKNMEENTELVKTLAGDL